MSNFYIGQEVVCIHDEFKAMQGNQKITITTPLKKGNIYQILGIRKMCCNILIDVGVSTYISDWLCANCMKELKFSEGILWCGQDRFAPIIPASHEKEIEKLLTESLTEKV